MYRSTPLEIMPVFFDKYSESQLPRSLIPSSRSASARGHTPGIPECLTARTQVYVYMFTDTYVYRSV